MFLNLHYGWFHVWKVHSQNTLITHVCTERKKLNTHEVSLNVEFGSEIMFCKILFFV